MRLGFRRPGGTAASKLWNVYFRTSPDAQAWLDFSRILQKGGYRAVRLFEIHEQKWFPQFLRDEFVDGLQMILDVTNAYRPIARLLRKRLEQCGAERVLDLCSGAGGPWPSLVRDFESCGAKPPEVLLTDKYPCAERLDNRASASASGIHFLAHSVDATQIPASTP